MRRFKFVGDPEEYGQDDGSNYLLIKNEIYNQGFIPWSYDTGSVLSASEEYPEDWEEVFDFEEEKKEILQEANKALRYNEGKPQWSLVDFKSLEPFVRVLEFGALKYERENWKKEMELNKILDSAQRHLASMIDGEQIDQESGLEHAGHVICNMMFYIYHCNK
jgi:hypothetical protein